MPNTMLNTIWQIAAVYLLVVNLVAFALMGIDKWKARRGAWRISEKMLFLSALLGGCLGGILGMQVFRHKTNHWYFRFGFPVILVLQMVLAAWLIWRFVLQ